MKSAALIIAALALVPNSVNATTLTITHGGAGFTPIIGRGGQFGGENFFVDAFFDVGAPTNLAFGVEPFVMFLSFGQYANVRVGDESCVARPPSGPGPTPDCGSIAFTSPGLARPADWPISMAFVATAPFTASGHLLVGGNRFDIVGSGTVRGIDCRGDPLCGGFNLDEPQAVTYAFSSFTVPEPGTYFLTLAFAMVIVGLALIRPLVS